MKRHYMIFTALALAFYLLLAGCGAGGEGDITTVRDTSFTELFDPGPPPFSRNDIAAVTGDLRTVQDYFDLVPAEGYYIGCRPQGDIVTIEFRNTDVPVAGGGDDIIRLLVRDREIWEAVNSLELIENTAPADFPAELLPLEAELDSICYSVVPMIPPPRGLGIGSARAEVLAAYPEEGRYIDDYPVHGGDIIPGWERVRYGRDGADGTNGDYIYYILNAEGNVYDVFFNTYRGADPSLQPGYFMDE